MSGGHFDYKQHYISDIAYDIEKLIKLNSTEDEHGYKNEYSDETLLRFKEAIKCLKIAETYVYRIDWLVSGDDGEETFHRRLKKELEELWESVLRNK